MRHLIFGLVVLSGCASTADHPTARKQERVALAVSALSACGDGIITYGEQCDDGNTTSGDGCSESCMFENGVWRCPPEFREDGYCDCGCGTRDPDCVSGDPSECVYCDDPGSCAASNCYAIDPTENSLCRSGC
jgi:cysteine-rich repeat protein